MEDLFGSSTVFDKIDLEGQASSYSIQSFKPAYSDLWGSYLGGDVDDDSQYDVREPNSPTLSMEGSDKKNRLSGLGPSLHAKRPRPTEVFSRLYNRSLSSKSQSQDVSALSVVFPFTPKLNENSLKIAQHLRSQTKAKPQRSTSVQASSGKKFLTLDKSKKLCLEKFCKEFSDIVDILSRKIEPFDFTQFSLQQMFYILAGLGFVSYNSKMDGFVEKEQKLARGLWKLLSNGGWISREKLEHALKCVEGLIEDKSPLFQREQFILLYYNRLNHQKAKKHKGLVSQPQTPTLSNRSRKLAQSCRRKLGINPTSFSIQDGLKFQELKKLEHQAKLSQQRARKQQEQIQKCTFKPKTLKNLDTDCLYNRPVKKKKVIALESRDQNPNKQNILPRPPTTKHQPKHPTQTPKSFAKEILRMRQCQKLKQSEKQAPTVRHAASRGAIILNVDVDLTDKLSQKIQIHQNDDPDQVLDKFCIKHNIESYKRTMLKDIVARELKKVTPKMNLR